MQFEIRLVQKIKTQKRKKKSITIDMKKKTKQNKKIGENIDFFIALFLPSPQN